MIKKIDFFLKFFTGQFENNIFLVALATTILGK
jgi:hypothetical protein